MSIVVLKFGNGYLFVFFSYPYHSDGVVFDSDDVIFQIGSVWS